jgi:iron-sulfur cluster assembly protein
MITLTENARTELRRQAGESPDASPIVRLSLKPGGCAGTTYVLDFPGEAKPGDQTFSQGEFTIAVDPDSSSLLRGLEIDFVDSLVGGGFSFKNPNAASSCGCGSSFKPLQQL